MANFDFKEENVDQAPLEFARVVDQIEEGKDQRLSLSISLTSQLSRPSIPLAHELEHSGSPSTSLTRPSFLSPTPLIDLGDSRDYGTIVRDVTRLDQGVFRDRSAYLSYGLSYDLQLATKNNDKFRLISWITLSHLSLKSFLVTQHLETLPHDGHSGYYSCKTTLVLLLKLKESVLAFLQFRVISTLFASIKSAKNILYESYLYLNLVLLYFVKQGEHDVKKETLTTMETGQKEGDVKNTAE
ncbi:hypothetical protein Syun_009126 [Stephania yunnanensis]|uniref:Uncharacterized protein n=1 Tax=Stephania yunnanensis TaxID=152371 RepID=A0AAP0PNR9_9MAGN